MIVEWTLEVCHNLQLKKETIFLTIYLLERMLVEYEKLSSKNLQLLSMCSIFMGCKYEEVYPPHLEQILQYCQNCFTKTEVIQF